MPPDSAQGSSLIGPAPVTRAEPERVAAWADRLHALTARLAAALTPSQIAAAVLEEACAAFGADRASMTTIDEDGDTTHMIGSIGYSDAHLSPWRSYSLRSSGAPTVDAVATGEPVFLESRAAVAARYSERFVATIDANQVGAIAILPISSGTRVRGVIGLAWPGARAFAAEERGFMRTFASQCGQALERAELFVEERASRDRVTRLQKITADLARALTPTAVGDVVISAVIRDFGAAHGSVRILTSDDSRFELVANGRLTPDQQTRWRAIPNAVGTPYGDMFASGQPLFLRSARDVMDRYPNVSDALAELETEAVAILPLTVGDRTAGAISLSYRERHDFRADERADLVTVAGQCAQALERAWLYEAERDARTRAEQAADRTARLQRVTAALAAAVKPEDVASAMLDHGLVAVGATAGVVCRLNGDATEIDSVWAVGYPADGLEGFRRVALIAPLPPRDVVQTRAPVFIESPNEWVERYLPPVPGMQVARAAAGLPLLVGERLVGVMVLRFPEPRRFSDDDRTQILSVASQCAQALERARLHQAESAARREAEEANRAKSEFLAVMSHELRTPLNAIAGHVQLLEMGLHGSLTEQQRDALGRVTRAQERLLGLINDVLNFARLEAGRVEYEIKPTRAADVLNEVAALMAPQFVARGLTCSVRVASSDQGEPIIVLADREKLAQVVLNLLSNAAKFTAAGGAIVLEAARLEADSDRTAIRVSDTGAGIPADKLQTIFEPFVQLGRGLTTTQEGTGLGLAISRELARGMNGELVAESVLGAGSTFTLTLPIAR